MDRASLQGADEYEFSNPLPQEVSFNNLCFKKSILYIDKSRAGTLCRPKEGIIFERTKVIREVSKKAFEKQYCTGLQYCHWEW